MDSEYFMEDESLGEDDCQLDGCLEPDRKILGLTVVVEVQGYAGQFHPDCARRLKENIRWREIHRRNRERALEN